MQWTCLAMAVAERGLEGVPIARLARALAGRPAEVARMAPADRHLCAPDGGGRGAGGALLARQKRAVVVGVRGAGLEVRPRGRRLEACRNGAEAGARCSNSKYGLVQRIYFGCLQSLVINPKIFHCFVIKPKVIKIILKVITNEHCVIGRIQRVRITIVPGA